MLTDVTEKWKSALPSEVDYWRGLFEQTSYDPKHIEAFMNRIKNEPAFQFESDLDDPPGATIRVLDVGAAPLTHIGRLNSRYNIKITAIDPLAEAYAVLWRNFGLEPRVTTVYGEGEKISEMFQPNEFDIVYSRNALDHSYDPVSAIKQMAGVCKKFVYMAGHCKEGESAQYKGLHSWNFEPTPDGDLLIWNPSMKASLKEELAGSADVSATGENWFQCRITPLG